MILWKLSLVIVNVLFGIFAINRPVQKIVLTQKGFAQFLQYDIETPPIREFTICTWIKLFSFDRDQTIFTYFVKGNIRVARLWLDIGGKNMKVSIAEEVTSITPVNLTKDVWRHVCLSYQSDYGAWAIYLDSRLLSCYASQRIQGLVLPANGSVFIGYGTASDGKQYGFEGEIFGVNMILKATIQENRSLAMNPRHKQKQFRKNILRNSNDPTIEYVILKDMKTVQNDAKFDPLIVNPFSMNSYIKVSTPGSIIEHDIGLDLIKKNPKKIQTSKEIEIFDFRTTSRLPETVKKPINFWELVNDAKNLPIMLNKSISKVELTGSGTQELPTISEYETPPPLEKESSISPISEKDIRIQKPPATESVYNTKPDFPVTSVQAVPNNTRIEPFIPEVEIPPAVNNEHNVYGQWSSGNKYANSVLDYLKTINFRQIPSTIPLKKTHSDDYPYPSEFRITKRKPSVEFRRPYLIHKRSKRQTKIPEINVKVLDDGLRDHILALHAETKPKDVEILPRGESDTKPDIRFYRSTDVETSIENSSLEKSEPRPFSKNHNYLKNHRYSNSTEAFNELISNLPFIKSVEYFIEDSEFKASKRIETNNDMYTKSFSQNVDDWHNVKTSKKKLTNNGKKKKDNMAFQYDGLKVINTPHDAVVKGRLMASKVSEQSNAQLQNVSIFKYNHGFLPGHYQEKVKEDLRYTANFDKSVKLGNVLNERYTIGNSDAEKKRSFEGGVERVPDINRYRSDLDKESTKVPPSLTAKVCKNIETKNRDLYVQPDESIDVSNIFSTIKEKNEAIEFVVQNYKICSLEDSGFQNNPLLFIDWSRTPVRLFGGAFANKTRDLCGFF